MELKPKDKVAAGRLRAAELFPYFRSGLWSLVVHYVPEGMLGTWGVTDTGILMVDNAATAKWSVEEVADTFLHELGHYLRKHGERGKAMGADKRLFNIAGDCEINDDLQAAGRIREGQWVLPKDFGEQDGDLAEVYYRAIEKQASKCPQCAAGGHDPAGGGKDGQQPGGGAGGRGHLSSKPSKNGWCGSGAGNPFPNEEQLLVGAPAGRSEAEAQQTRRAVAEDIRQEAQKGQGTIPGDWLRWADAELQPPRIDWRTKLARAVRNAISFRAGAVDFRYDRPSRRQSSVGWGVGRPVLPALRMPVPRVGVGIDTSGSMGDRELRTAVEEASGILEAAGAEVSFIACDAAVHEAKTVRNVNELCAALKGGGGTDFRPVFQAVGEMRPRPEVFVYITDGMGPAPASPPAGVTCIWLLVGPYQCRPHFDGGVEWGEFVEIPHETKEKAA